MSTSDERQMKPEPMRLVLLDQMHLQAQGTKIRFLGCVHEYQGKTATLKLKERFPASPDSPTILVTITNILESLNHELVQVGAWLNIIGYVTKAAKLPRQSSSKRKSSTRYRPAVVDALMVWSAGAIKLQEYNSAVTAYQGIPEDAG